MYVPTLLFPLPGRLFSICVSASAQGQKELTQIHRVSLVHFFTLSFNMFCTLFADCCFHAWSNMLHAFLNDSPQRVVVTALSSTIFTIQDERDCIQWRDHRGGQPSDHSGETWIRFPYVLPPRHRLLQGQDPNRYNSSEAQKCALYRFFNDIDSGVIQPGVAFSIGPCCPLHIFAHLTNNSVEGGNNLSFVFHGRSDIQSFVYLYGLFLAPRQHKAT